MLVFFYFQAATAIGQIALDTGKQLVASQSVALEENHQQVIQLAKDENVKLTQEIERLKAENEECYRLTADHKVCSPILLLFKQTANPFILIHFQVTLEEAPQTKKRVCYAPCATIKSKMLVCRRSYKRTV